MAPPDNDLRANAQVLDASLGWGIVRGTTVGATEEPGEPYGGGSVPVRSVWYVIPYLAPGAFYFKFGVEGGPLYFDWAVFRGATGADSMMEGSSLAPVLGRFENHAGGPLTIMVATYADVAANFGGEGSFVFGWGSSHDRTESHYRPRIVSPWNAVESVPTAEDTSIHLRYSFREGVRGVYNANYGYHGDPIFFDIDRPNDPIQDACVYENARWGQVKGTAALGEECIGFLGPGPGTGVRSFFVDSPGVGQYVWHQSGGFFGYGHTARFVCTMEYFAVTLGDIGAYAFGPPPSFPQGADNWGPIYDDGWAYTFSDLRNLSIVGVSCTRFDPGLTNPPSYEDETPWNVEVRTVLEGERVIWSAAETATNQWAYEFPLTAVMTWPTPPDRSDHPLLATMDVTPGPKTLPMPGAIPYLQRPAPGPDTLPAPRAPTPVRLDRPYVLMFYLVSSSTRAGRRAGPASTTRGFYNAVREYPMLGAAIEWRFPPYRPYGFPLGCPPFAKAAFKRAAPRLVESYKASMRVTRIKPVKVSPFQGLRCRFGPCNAKRSKVRVVPHESG